jgi:acetyltransferase-like isoleucine patch superfamily enzyme
MRSLDRHFPAFIKISRMKRKGAKIGRNFRIGWEASIIAKSLQVGEKVLIGERALARDVPWKQCFH